MFQNLWNVAAAFCVHEESVSITENYHFGHHTNVLCVSEKQEKQSHEVYQQQNYDFEQIEEHQDHLPSMTHFILEESKFTFLQTLFLNHYRAKYFWKSDYISPDLISLDPPPEFSPLLVG